MSNKKDFNPIAIYLVLSLLFPAWLGLVYGIITRGNLENITNFTYIATLISELLIFGIFIIKYRVKLLEDAKKLKLNQIFTIILIAAAVITFNEILTNLFAEVETENQDIIVDMFNTYRIPTIISVALFAPIIEELVFRYSIGTLVKNNKVFLAISSIAFGAMHGIGIITILYVIIGLILGLIYLKYKKNIVAPIIVHILNNTLSVILILIGI